MSTTVGGQVIPNARMVAIRAVFSALFDAVDTIDSWDEGRWIDLMAAFNATGRLVFGWPHIESSESDIFAAMDVITEEIGAAKTAMQQTAKDTRIVLGQLHEALDPILPEDEPAEPEPDPPLLEEHKGSVGPVQDTETELSESVATNFPSPRALEMPERASMDALGPIEAEREKGGQILTTETPIPPGLELDRPAHRGRYDKDPPDKEVAEFYETHTKVETAAEFGISVATVGRKVRRFEEDTSEPRRNGTKPRTPLRPTARWEPTVKW